MPNIDGIEYVMSSQIAQMTPATLRAFDKMYDKGNVVIVKDMAGKTLEAAVAKQNAEDETYRAEQVKGA